MKKIITTIIVITMCYGCGKFHPKPWTTEEKVLLAASCLAATADTYTQIQIFNDGGYEKINPIPGKHPSKSKFISYMITSQIIAVLIAHYFPDYRKFVLGSKTIINGSFAIHNNGVR